MRPDAQGAFDALLSKRRDKRSWTMEEAIAELVAQRGRHFDPGLVDIFVGLVPGLDEEWPTDARGVEPSVGVLTFDQSTAAGATERIHSRNAAPPTRA